MRACPGERERKKSMCTSAQEVKAVSIKHALIVALNLTTLLLSTPPLHLLPHAKPLFLFLLICTICLITSFTLHLKGFCNWLRKVALSERVNYRSRRLAFKPLLLIYTEAPRVTRRPTLDGGLNGLLAAPLTPRTRVSNADGE